jgi:amidase
VQLMGPANSDGMLISLAAELEAVCGWSTKQPAAWWTAGPDVPPTPPASRR